jgi:hypothetical protein
MSHLEFDDLYGSKYLSATDLKGRRRRLKIDKVEPAELREKTGDTKWRWILYFEGEEKALVLNKTNATEIAKVFGKNPDDWVGQFVELFSVPTSFGEGVRVRPLRKPATVADPDPDPDLNDAIQF